MKLQQLRSFVTAYQERSFTAAARRLNATQSGLSMQVKDLETSLGVRLFERSTTGVRPTVAGEMLYGHARTILRQISEAGNELAALAGEVTGTVDAGLMPTITRGALAPAVIEFTAQYAHVRLRLVEAYSATLTEMVASEQLDFAIVPPHPGRSAVNARALAHDREFLVTGPCFGRAHMAPVRLGEVRPLKLILPTPANARRAGLDAYLAGIGVVPDAILEMDAMMGTLELVGASDWMAILPATLCYPDLGGNPLRVHPLIDPELGVDYALIEPATRTLSPAAQLFAAAVERQMRRIADEWDKRLGAIAAPGEDRRRGPASGTTSARETT
jgi:DNA-binding transcriptional LysR family regulator